MTKRKYVSPTLTAVQIACHGVICGSQDIASPNAGISYGGIDEEGTQTPEARRRGRGMWSDEEGKDEPM